MRTGHTGFKVVTAVAILLSGWLLLYQVQGATADISLPISAHWLFAVALGSVVTAAAIWGRPAGPGRVVVTGLAVFATQFVLLIATGVVLEVTAPRAPGDQLVAPFVRGVVFLAAALLAIAVWMPLRGELSSARTRRRADALRARRNALAQQQLRPAPDPQDDSLGFALGVKEREPEAATTGPAPTQGPVDAAGDAQQLEFDGDLEIPAGLVWQTLLHAGVIEQTSAGRLRPDQVISIPAQMAAPGLREGSVALPLSALAPYLPQEIGELAAGDAGEMVNEPLIKLPLEMVVPQVPKEAFVVPEREMPEWMAVEPEEGDSEFVFSALSRIQESESDGIS